MRRSLLVYKVLQHWDFLNSPSRWLVFSLLAEAALREANGAVAPGPALRRSLKIPIVSSFFIASYYRTWMYVLYGIWTAKKVISFWSSQTLTPPLPISLKIRGPWLTYRRPLSRSTFYLWTMTIVKWNNIFAVLCQRLTPLTTFIDWWVFWINICCFFCFTNY